MNLKNKLVCFCSHDTIRQRIHFEQNVGCYQTVVTEVTGQRPVENSNTQSVKKFSARQNPFTCKNIISEKYKKGILLFDKGFIIATKSEMHQY